MKKKIPTYADWADKVHRTISHFPMGFAFSDEQFEEQKKKLGVTENNELIAIPGNGFIRKKDKKEFKKLFSYLDTKKEEFLKSAKFVYEMFLYEMDNYEYGLTMNKAEVLAACELSWKQVKENPMYMQCFIRAEQDYFDTFQG